MKNFLTLSILVACLLIPTILLAQPVTVWMSRNDNDIDFRALNTANQEEATEAAVWFVQKKDSGLGLMALMVDGRDIPPGSEVTFAISNSSYTYKMVVNEESWIDGGSMTVRGASNYCDLLEDIRKGDVLSVSYSASESKIFEFSLAGAQRNLSGFAVGCGELR